MDTEGKARAIRNIKDDLVDELIRHHGEAYDNLKDKIEKLDRLVHELEMGSMEERREREQMEEEYQKRIEVERRAGLN